MSAIRPNSDIAAPEGNSDSKCTTNHCDDSCCPDRECYCDFGNDYTVDDDSCCPVGECHCDYENAL